MTFKVYDPKYPNIEGAEAVCRIFESTIPTLKERLVMAEKNDTQNMIHAVTTVQYTKQDFLDILKVFFDGCVQLIRVAKEPPSSI